MKALVLEDTLQEYNNIESILKEKNIQIEHYHRTEDAISAINSGRKYDLYIIDYVLEGSKEGDAAITQILVRHKDAKVILNSSSEYASEIADRLGVAYSNKKPENLKAKIDAILGIKTYEGMTTETAILEYSLDFLHNCLVPETITEAETSFEKLKAVAIDLKLEESQYKKLDVVYEKFTVLISIAAKNDPFSNEYISSLSGMRDDLLSLATRSKGK